MKREEISIILLCTVILILFSIRLSMENQYTTQGQLLLSLNERLHTLQMQDLQLEDEILSLGSLTNISTIAKQEGFIQTTTISF